MFLFGDFNSPFVNPFGELFLCHPSLWRVIFVPTIELSMRPSLWRVIFVSSIPWGSYFLADYLIIHPLLSFFCADHITLHPSIVLESYFCAVHPLGELFSCRPFNVPIPLSFWRVIFVSSIPRGELFPC